MALYPKKAKYFLESLKKLRQVSKNSKGSYIDLKGRETVVTFRVPTELWMFILRWIPDFGKTDDDVHLLINTWSDLCSVGNLYKKRTLLTSESMVKALREKKSESKRSSDSEERSKGTEEVSSVLEAVPSSAG